MRKETPEEKKYRQELKAYRRQEKEKEQEYKKKLSRELKVLRFMKKTDVLYYHHGTSESMMKRIEKGIQMITKGHFGARVYTEYHPYYWNYSPNKSSEMPLSYLGCLFNSSFETIYDVPLDGTYIFEIRDSGERGLGSFDRIFAKKVQ